MITVSSERVSLSRVGVLIATVTLLAMLLLCGSKAEAAQRFGKNGVVYACFKAKGKGKGTLRVVGSPRKCKKLRGWRAMSWSTQGSSGQAGSGGPQGAPGPQGEPGTTGAQGLAGQVEQSLLDTVDDQADQIQSLTTQVTTLSGQVGDLETDLGDVTSDVTGLTSDVAGLEGTVGDVCGQVGDLTEQSDELLTAIAGIEVDTLLAVLLDIPPLPDALGTFEC